MEEKISTIAPVSEDYAHTLAYESGAMMDWLSEGLGLPMQATAEHSNAHSLTSTEDGLFGEQLVRALKKKLEENNVDVRTANRATEILMEDGKVAGVKVETANGEYTISSPYVALHRRLWRRRRSCLRSSLPPAWAMCARRQVQHRRRPAEC